MRGLLILVLTIALVAPASADADRDDTIEALYHAAITDRPRVRRAIRRKLVRLGALSAEAARRIPSRRAILRWLVEHDLGLPRVAGFVITGEPEPGTVRISFYPERCDDDFYTWAVVDVGPDGWTLVDSGVGDDC